MGVYIPVRSLVPEKLIRQEQASGIVLVLAGIELTFDLVK